MLSSTETKSVNQILIKSSDQSADKCKSKIKTATINKLINSQTIKISRSKS